VLMLIGDSYAIQESYKKAREEYGRILVLPGIPPAQKIEAQEKIAGVYRAELNFSQARKEYGKILKMEGLTSRLKEEIEQKIRYIYR